MESVARTRAETANSNKSKPCALVVKTRRTRTGCLTCRDRHVKCDEGAPICERCRKVGRECVRGWNVKFVHGVRTARETVNDEWDGSADYLFDARQKWVPIRSVNLTFVDETNETRSSYTRPNVSSPAESSFISPIQSPNTRHPSSPSVVGPPGHQQGSSSPRSHVVTSHRDDLSPSGTSFHGPYLSHNIIQSVVDHSLDLLGNAAGGEELSSTPPETVFHEQGKLSSEEETYLLHHFIRDRAPLLDICDPHQHFARLVPELALKSPLLFNAVLAVSAHHLSRTAGYDPMMAEMYHERCVEILISLLNDMSLVSDEVVAATVLLRYYEQMSSAVTGFDCERHLTGTSAFMNSESTCATAGGLRQASFWIFVRQDLDVALSQQRPLRLNLEAYAVEMDLDIPSDDWGWANRIVWITAEVVAFSFGWDKPRMKYEELRIKTEAWMHRKPESFRPFYVGRGSAFPTVYYSQLCHAIGMQYYHITMILLALADSQRLKIGFGHEKSRRQLQQEIAHYAGLLFGTCTTVDDPGTRITACNALSVCAPWLTDRAQQESLIAMLRGLERDVAWPTRRIALGAMAEWNWTEEQRRRFL